VGRGLRRDREPSTRPPVDAASNQKLWTAAGIHLSLPTDFTFRTEVMTTGTLRDGVPVGRPLRDRWRRPHPDHDRFSLARLAGGEIKRRGIDRIAGRVVIDESRYDVTRTPGGGNRGSWTSSDLSVRSWSTGTTCAKSSSS
jgi:D-alanyl-D-alanine carboxypeptidase